MNYFLKLTLFIWLMLCAFIAWAGCAVFGFFFAFTQYPWVYDFTPFIGLTVGFCLIKCAFYVLNKSNPVAFIEGMCARVFKKTQQ